MNILKNYLKVIVYDGFMYFDLCINVKSFNFIRNSNRIGDLESYIYHCYFDKRIEYRYIFLSRSMTFDRNRIFLNDIISSFEIKTLDRSTRA